MADGAEGSQVTEPQGSQASSGGTTSGGTTGSQNSTQTTQTTQAAGGGSAQTTQTQTTPQSQPFSQVGWEAPIEWQDNEGKSIQAKMGELIETHMAAQRNKPFVQLGQLVNAAVSGDQKARQVLAGIFQNVERQRAAGTGQTPRTEPQHTPAVPPEFLQRQQAIEKMLMDKTVNDIKTGLGNYIQQSKFSALKVEPKIVDLIQGKLMEMVKAGVQPTQRDVDNMLETWNNYYKDLAMKITNNQAGVSGNSYAIPPLGTGAAASAQGTPKDVRWGNNPEQPDPKFRQYLMDKIQNLMAENAP